VSIAVTATDDRKFMESTSLWIWSERDAGILWEPQGLVEMRVIKYVPEPTDDLAIGPRLIRKDTIHRSQRECEKRVAAALQRRLYGGRTHEIAASHNRRGIRQAAGGRQILPQQMLRHLDGIDNYAIRTHERETHAKLWRSTDLRTAQIDLPRFPDQCLSDVRTETPPLRPVMRSV
jgi:hypothetical protein